MKFEVYSHETVFYRIEVEAESEEAAMQLFYDGEVCPTDADVIESDCFEVEYANAIA